MNKKFLNFLLLFLLSSLLLFIYFNCTQTNSSTDETTTSTTTTTTIGSDRVVFEPIGGMYKNSVHVTLKSKFPHIYYTLDGKTPDENSIKYTGPIIINKTTLIRAMATDGTEKHYSMSCFDIDDKPDFNGTRKASPNWQDQVIYFLMIDRFFNGDKENDIQVQDQTQKDFLYGDKTKERHYNGGDLKGIEQKLDYIKNLGATAIWITPPVKNQYSEGQYCGYHGYWASNFKEVDPHFGTLEDYQNLVKAAHNKGLYVIQDIVVNHTGDYFKVKISPITDVLYTGKWSLTPNSIPLSHPEQLPWSMNDPKLFTQEEFDNDSFYHWTPAITDYNKPELFFNYQMSDLDDINTDNKVVQNLLRGYFRYWIDKVDIDGYRVDTVKYVHEDFFEDFCNSTEPNNKGVREHAKDLGKNDFIVFGEAWDEKDEHCIGYTQSSSGKPRMDSIIYFPLTFAVRSVFNGGSPTNLISKVLNQRYTIGYANPDKLVTFIDNHDMTRSLQIGDPNLVKAAYALIFTIPGIPQIYYGTEQGFNVARRSMMKGCYKEEGAINEEDMFKESGEWYDYIKNLIKMRKENEIFRYGKVTVFADSTGPGILAYKSIKGNGGVNNAAIVVFNTSLTDKAITNISTGFNAGNIFTRQSIFVGNVPQTLTIGVDGKLTALIPPKSFGIYIMSSEGSPPQPPSNSITISIDSDSTTDPVTLYTLENLKIKGTLKNSANVRIFIDGEYTLSKSFAAGTTFTKEISLKGIANGLHSVCALIDTGDPNTYLFSNTLLFQFVERYTEVISISDPVGDDTGPAGKQYTIPTHISYKDHPQDITNVRILTADTNLKIEITMRGTTNIWKPTVNNFDHVEFAIFLQKPNSTSTTDIFPLHNYNIPMKWDYLSMQNGWGSSLYSSEGATTVNYGNTLSPSPSSEVDHTKKTITFKIDPASIGRPDSLSGWKIYINTWDKDFDLPRGLEPKGGEYRFGGGDGSVDPLVIDETSIITIP